MKTLKTTLVALSLLFVTSAFANGIDNTNSPEKASLEISALLNNPDFLVVETETVAVEFVLNKNKEVVVLSVDCDSSEICAFISDRLNRKVLESKLEQGKVYTLPVKFVSKD
jgi:hypothetical protein